MAPLIDITPLNTEGTLLSFRFNTEGITPAPAGSTLQERYDYYKSVLARRKR